MTDKTEDTKSPKELSQEDLDKVQGAGAKGLVGDELGIPLSGGIRGPQPKSMERVHEDE